MATLMKVKIRASSVEYWGRGLGCDGGVKHGWIDGRPLCLSVATLPDPATARLPKLLRHRPVNRACRKCCALIDGGA